MEEIRIAGVVVLYYPNIDELNQNINSYIDHIDLLMVVANSEIDETLLVKTNKIEIIKNEKNLGIAKALNQAAEFARNRAFNWLLTMDQDSRFLDSFFFNAFNFTSKSNVAIISPNHDMTSSVKDLEPLEISEKEVLVMTSGNIINLDIWRDVGGFDEQLFIDEVDHDYCFKVKLNGAKILKFENIYLKHNLGVSKCVKILNIRKSICLHSPVRSYYIFRNNLVIFKRYYRKFPRIVLVRIVELIKEFVRILLFQNERRLHLKNIFLGVLDFMNGRLGIMSKIR